MEKRFGIKDLFLFLLIGAVGVAVILSMVQFDRQYREVMILKQDNKGIATDLNNLKKDIRAIFEAVDDIKSRPVTVAPTTQGTATGATTQPAVKADPFAALREAEKMPGFARGDWLIDNFGTKIGKLTPVVSSDIYQRWVEYQVLERLCDSDPHTLDAVPRLATRWEISPDGLRMKFYLRRGVEFSDGQRLTADDVLFTFNWIQNPKVDGESQRAYLKKLKEVKKIDDYTVEFIFSEFYYLNFDVVAGISIMPAHFYSKYTPEQFNERPGLLLGSGPYRLESPDTWSPGQPVQLVRNERFWGEQPPFNRLIYREVQGESTQVVMYRNQEHDIVRCTPEQYRTMLADKGIMSFSNNFEFNDVYGGYRYIGWNQMRDKAPTRFADTRVRRAMTMLIDRERIVNEIYLGYATNSSGPFSPKGPQSDPEVKPLPYDEATAKSLLKEAGFEDRNQDGIIEGKDGSPFKFVLTYPSGNETYEKVVLFLKDGFARAGIVMEPDRVDWPVLVQRYNSGSYDAIALGFSSSPESDPYQVFHSSQIENQGDNRTHYINKELDKLIETARTTVNKEERMKLWHKVHRTLNEDQPYTFLNHRNDLWIIHNRIKNIKEATIGLNFLPMNPAIMPWFVPAAQQKYTQ